MEGWSVEAGEQVTEENEELPEFTLLCKEVRGRILKTVAGRKATEDGIEAVCSLRPPTRCRAYFAKGRQDGNKVSSAKHCGRKNHANKFREANGQTGKNSHLGGVQIWKRNLLGDKDFLKESWAATG